jgi:uncharacterized membrane protein
MPIFSTVDWIAFAVFAVSWAGYSWVVDHSPWRSRSLTALMDRQRGVWMQMMLKRDVRIVDTSIIAGLQNGTAFFASTSLLAIGAAFALLTTSDQVLGVVRDLPLGVGTSRAAWEIKALALLAIYAYAFFKFQWSYRLFNYTSILIGAVPPAAERETAEAHAAVERAARMSVLAGRHFTRGQRAFFFSVGFLGWFASAWLFLAVTLMVVVALAFRQFAFPARELLRES